MIEVHYGHLNPTMQADIIAGKRHVPKPVDTAKTTDDTAKLDVADANQPKAKPVAKKSVPRKAAKKAD
jgi:hypothetical protein